MLVYSSRKSNRLSYMLRTLLGEALGLQYQHTTDKERFLHAQGPRLAYSDEAFSGCLTVKPHTILFDHGIRDYHLEVQTHDVFHRLFFRNNGSDIPFDIFGAAFWLLSRYEEYLPFKGDAHGRFQARSSLAYQYDFLEVPLVNVWVEKFGAILARMYPAIELRKRSYSFVSTIDVDNVYKYRDKGFVRTVAGLLSDRNVVTMRDRLSIVFHRRRDPFDCYDFLLEAHRTAGVPAIFFFLLGDYGPNDKNHSASDLRFQALIKHLSDYARVGIHPSYGSNASLRQLKVEFARLANITHRLITRSRQHFSMLRFPKTYENLLEAGLTSDYSMGYPSANGFRASYATPYKWFNLETESVTALTVHPYCLTDHVLTAESRRTSRSALELAAPLVAAVKRSGGELVALFHNESFDDRMREFYTSFLQMAAREDL